MFWVFTLSHWLFPTWCCVIYNLRMFFHLVERLRREQSFVFLQNYGWVKVQLFVS